MGTSPTQAAAQVLKAWFHTKAEDKRFPVDCRAIAEGFNIVVHGDRLDTEFEGGLFDNSGTPTIIYNENIKEERRINFTVAHELGHYFLHRLANSVQQCSSAALNTFDVNQAHKKNVEREANCFAASLLMPVGDFRKNIKGHTPSVSLIITLAERYQTSLTATAYRMVELANQPLALVIVKGKQVHRWQRNEHMKDTGFWLQNGNSISNIELSNEGVSINSEQWLSEQNAHSWSMHQSSIYMPKYDQMLILLTADSKEYEEEEWDDVLDSVDLIPKW